jgi:hypothetical protein
VPAASWPPARVIVDTRGKRAAGKKVSTPDQNAAWRGPFSSVFVTLYATGDAHKRSGGSNGHR